MIKRRANLDIYISILSVNVDLTFVLFLFKDLEYSARHTDCIYSTFIVFICTFWSLTAVIFPEKLNNKSFVFLGGLCFKKMMLLIDLPANFPTLKLESVTLKSE